MTTEKNEHADNRRSGEEPVGGDSDGPERSLWVELWKYSLLMGMGGLIALLSSYLVRQFGF